MARLHGPDEPVYTISVAARLLCVSMQTLRQYEANGLVCPARSERGTRFYSENDLVRLKRIIHLSVNQGINMAGVREILRRDGTLPEQGSAEGRDDVAGAEYDDAVRRTVDHSQRGNA